MKYRCCVVFVSLITTIACSLLEEKPHKLAKRQSISRPGQQSFPLSRSRQYPPPEEELEDVSYEDPSPPVRSYQFRGRQQPPEEDEVSYDYYTEAPQTTTPTVPPTTTKTTTTTTTTTTKAPNRISAFNRVSARPRFGQSPSSTARPAAAAAVSSSRTRTGSAQRLDVVSDILNRPPPPRPQPPKASSAPKLTSRSDTVERKPSSDQIANRRSSESSGRGSRPRGRFRTRSTTTTTTTTTAAPEEYYYYYYDEEEDNSKVPVATTTSTTTTTTTTTQKPPSLPRRPSLNKRPSTPRTSSTVRTAVKFDPESQFQAPPEDADVTLATRSTKRFTTSTTPIPEPGAEGIPYHLRGKYKPRKDGRFVDYFSDPNRPRELKGFDLSDYPFYIRVPDDIDFDCEDKKDGYYASVPHHCQLFHYCFAGSRYDFLCANYTLYDQTTFTCRFANNVDCPSSEKYYYRNDDLWKVTTTTEKPKAKKVASKVEDDDEEYYDDDEYYDDEEEERRRRRPKRRRNRRRKNRTKQSTVSAASTSE